MRPLVVADIRHAQIPMVVVVALAVFGLIAYVAERPPQLMSGVFLGLVVAYFTFPPRLARVRRIATGCRWTRCYSCSRCWG